MGDKAPGVLQNPPPISGGRLNRGRGFFRDCRRRRRQRRQTLGASEVEGKDHGGPPDEFDNRRASRTLLASLGLALSVFHRGKPHRYHGNRRETRLGGLGLGSW